MFTGWFWPVLFMKDSVQLLLTVAELPSVQECNLKLKVSRINYSIRTGFVWYATNYNRTMLMIGNGIKQHIDIPCACIAYPWTAYINNS